MKIHLRYVIQSFFAVSLIVLSGCQKLPYADLDRQKIDMENCEPGSFDFLSQHEKIGCGFQIGDLDGHLNEGIPQGKAIVKQVFKGQGVSVMRHSLLFFVETSEDYAVNDPLPDGVYVQIGKARLHRDGGEDFVCVPAFIKMEAKYLESYRERLAVARQKEIELQKQKLAQQACAREKFVSNIKSYFVDIPGRDYKMGKTEVTQDQWMLVMETNPSQFKGGDLPVENVTFRDVELFIKKLNGSDEVKNANVKFRLPTSEEWDHACSLNGESKLKTGFHTSWPESHLRHAEAVAKWRGEIGREGWFGFNSEGSTHPVARKKPNGWGLFDMKGNVREWSAYASPKGVGFNGSYWSYNNIFTGLEYVLDFSEDRDHRSRYSNDGIGFRLVVELP